MTAPLIQLPTIPEGWELHAACSEYDAELFFPISYDSPEGRLQVEEARATCAQCPVVRACLVAALQREGGKNATNRFGIWGGTTPSQRYYIIHRRRPSQQRKVAA